MSQISTFLDKVQSTLAVGWFQQQHHFQQHQSNLLTTTPTFVHTTTTATRSPPTLFANRSNDIISTNRSSRGSAQQVFHHMDNSFHQLIRQHHYLTRL
ncbi:hypothetical protein BC941DRAFT_442490 [Chlamydoabsidia padenii]|nr:hypothetical protein BC941DRAFT_442490 [Chlamydoabsidia padenii]